MPPGVAAASGASGWRRAGVAGLAEDERFGAKRLSFTGPDGDELALVEADDARAPWTGGGVPEEAAIRGFHGASLRLRDAGATAELLRFMGYAGGGEGRRGDPLPARGRQRRRRRSTSRRCRARRAAGLGAGSVHHIAFAVPDRAAQLEVRKALVDTGYQVTPVIDRDYFWSIYFRTPGGVLFEVATNEPGFDRDEDTRASRRGAEAAEAARAPARLAGEHLEPIA